jgi:histidinol dehydrogenase
MSTVAGSRAPGARSEETDVVPQPLDWDALGEPARAQVLARATRAQADEVAASVRRIVAEVRTGGDDALRALGRRLDGVVPERLQVGADELAAAGEALSPELRSAIAAARRRIEHYHRAGMAAPYAVETAPGVRCERILRPIARVGLYVPAGSAPLPSTALMLGVPARLAGCPEVVLCTPPRRDGSADPAVLHAAWLCGVETVFKVGGAQAIAAMALGTGSVPACDKLFGPGNAWVSEAKRQLAREEGGPAIDLPAGPSEVMVIADAQADPAFVAADLLSQAEHGPDSQVLLVSDSGALLDAVAIELRAQLAMLPRAHVAARALQGSRLLRVAALGTAFEIANRYAPEHLILALREPRAWLDLVRAAGSVFLGDWTPEALGDYCSGTNHVLPTGGAARAWSGLSVASFQLAISVQEASAEGLRAIGPDAEAIARSEGLDAHARSVSLRLAALDGRGLPRPASETGAPA